MSEDVKVPEGWKRLKLGEIVENLKKVAPPMSKPYLEIGDIDINSKSYKLKDKEAPNYCLVAYKDNIVISKVRPTRGAIAKIKETKIFVSPALLVLKYSNPSFLFYSLSRDAFFNFLGKLETGTTYPSVNDIDILSYEILFPPISTEQQKIAEILETVDNAIEKTDKIIEKYKRIKQGLMQELLTKGIDENGRIRSEKTHKFKDSPIGRIPEEWEVVRLGEVVDLRLSNVDKKIFDKEKKVLLCNYLEVYQNDYITKKLNFMVGSVNNREFEKFKIYKGDVIITKDSEEFNDIAKPAYVRDEIDNLVCGYHLALLKVKENIEGLFLSKILAFPSINIHFQKQANGITRFGITKETIENAFIPLPPLPEQQRIAEILSQIDNVIEKEEAYKQKLEQIKKGLMEDLLTGKVRVNNLLLEEENEK